MKGLRLKPFTTIHCRDGEECPTPCLPARISKQIIFAKSLNFFPCSVIFFTIYAEKVCYKLANMYYELCNMCYKLSNMCYKLCNKNFLI